jgi:hypothetical protein
LTIDLAFLDATRYRVAAVRDDLDNAATVRIDESTVTNQQSIRADLRAGGGFIARLQP